MVDKVEDLLSAGVIDPAKVTKNGLLNSCSIAGIMLTTQASDAAGLPQCAPHSNMQVCAMAWS